jgi:hypothetical protein
MPNNANPALHEPRACIGAPTTLRGRLRFIGPSLILTATLVGSGGLILTTTLGARVGFAALWIIILSCVLKVPLQESLGRYTISSGDTTLLATNRLPGPRFNVSWIVWFWLGGILLTTAQLGAIATLVGESLSMILPALDGNRVCSCIVNAAEWSLSSRRAIVDGYGGLSFDFNDPMRDPHSVDSVCADRRATPRGPAIPTPGCRLGNRACDCRPEFDRANVLLLLVPGKGVRAFRRSKLVVA